ncbi:hypothetical protein L7F22_017668 [Adiantum nelumboides]|nr:hypothetical protein [Adiantum nelumboides]
MRTRKAYADLREGVACYDYSTDEDFVEPYDALVCGEHPDSYSLKDGFLMFRGKLCVPRPLRQKDTESFVRSCQCVKYDRGKAYQLLQPLLILTAPWESIAMDFIFGLPRTSSGNEGIWTIVDRFSKPAHFIPVRKEITAEQMAKTFLVTVFMNHGMPRSIVSDSDPRMTRLFWRALWQNLHSTLRFSSSYHPQTNGQSKIVNSATRLRKQKGEEKFYPKLRMRYYGPFQITEVIKAISYRLSLSASWKIHNAFHVSLLRQFVGELPNQPEDSPQPEVDELDEVLQLEQILAHKERRQGSRMVRRYLVKFKNYSAMDSKWMEEADLDDTPQILDLYLEAFSLQPTIVGSQTEISQ